MKGLLRKIGIPMLLLAIGTTATAQDQLLLLTQSDLGYESQTWFCSGSDSGLQQDKIKANWDEDRYITSAAYTSHGWFVTMAKNTGFTGQTYHYAADWPSDWIYRKRSEGYYLTTIASNRTHWFIVLSKGTGYTGQYTLSHDNWSDSEAEIRKKWNEGFHITQATYTGTRWFIVMSKNSNYDRQGYLWATSEESLREKIKAKWDKGYNLTLLEFGDANTLPSTRPSRAITTLPSPTAPLRRPPPISSANNGTTARILPTWAAVTRRAARRRILPPTTRRQIPAIRGIPGRGASS